MAGNKKVSDPTSPPAVTSDARRSAAIAAAAAADAAYEASKDPAREAALDELVAEAQRLVMGYDQL